MPLSKKRNAERMRRLRAAKKAEGGKKPQPARSRVRVYPLSGKAMVEYMKHIEAKGETLQYVDWVTGELLEVPVGEWGYRLGDSPMGRKVEALEKRVLLHEAEHELREAVERYELSEQGSE